MTIPHIVIGIPTFRRPKGLERLLISIAAQDAPFVPKVLVADNDGESGAGLAVVANLQSQGFPFPICGIAVPERGISQVRNALMEYSFGVLMADMLIMVDDDEWVAPDWIYELVAMQKLAEADVVSGYVKPEFEGGEPAWAKDLSIYYRSMHQPGIISTVFGTTSVLFIRRIYDLGMRFDSSFSLTGGGDIEFFTRLKLRGGTFAFAPKAISYEVIGLSRATKKWAIRRAFRVGNSDSRVFKIHTKGWKSWLFQINKIMGGIIFGSFMALICIWLPNKRMWAILMVARQIGKIMGFWGITHEEYKVTYGN